ncbi:MULTISPECIES: hypothetical protein [Methylobacteriaceae]|uniref:Transposase IS891/IS1136/IS1341 domain-containing protein n=1 Tax=Methylorubrum zatmanii TaxID=29429 RepID=A0ABW1WMS0_9HYPH
MPESLGRIEARKWKAQKVVSRRKRGSNRRRRAQVRVARLQARQARIRRDFHHREALGVARRFGVGRGAGPQRPAEGRAERRHPERALASVRDDPELQD